MKKTYINPETTVILLDQTHIYTILSGVENGNARILDYTTNFKFE